jgi:U4/U6.U5 tri-snRNP component SNU23
VSHSQARLSQQALRAHSLVLCCVAQEEAAEDAKRAKVSSNLGIVVRKPLNREDMISRDYNAELKARVGTKTLVSPDNPNAAGFLCKETGKTLRDSISYLDHINGKKRASLYMEPPLRHGTDCDCASSAEQRALGMSMRVERSTLEDVQAKFEAHKRQREEEAQRPGAPGFEARVQAAVEEEEHVKQQRRERKVEKKKQQQQIEAGPAAEEDGGGLDPEMAAMMGFKGFAGR